MLGILLLIYWFLLPYFDHTPAINEFSRTCLVTGVSSGLGKEISIQMIKKGWKVIGIARRQEKLNELSKDLGQKFIPFICDVSQYDQVQQASNQIKKEQLKPTLFFLNAGTGDIDQPYKFSFKQNIDTFNTNYFGTISWVEQWLNELKSYGGGTFVATSSVVTLYPTPGSASYSASKAAINACFHSLRLQYKKDNIGFITVIQGPIKTEMLKSEKSISFTHESADDAKYIIEKIFDGRKQIETSWYYSIVLRILNWLPDSFALKVL